MTKPKRGPRTTREPKRSREDTRGIRLTPAEMDRAERVRVAVGARSATETVRALLMLAEEAIGTNGALIAHAQIAAARLREEASR